ncbi:YlxR family protein [Mycolicibacterium sp. 120322]|uniref:YlxR family protein n=1 Tax=Mycolicibacterium sp. 120322 TaxID=3096109 RepID=UPI002ED7B0AC
MIQRESPASTRQRNPGSSVGPVRTCVGCRKRELANELFRVVAVIDGNGQCAVTVDTTTSLPGRGAWLHPDRQCVQVAIQRRAFVRALRIAGSPDTSAVVEFVEELSASTARSEEQVAKNMSTP